MIVSLWLVASFGLTWAFLYALAKFTGDEELLFALRMWRRK